MNGSEDRERSDHPMVFVHRCGSTKRLDGSPGHELFATRAEAERAVLEYIEVFYNRERLHLSLEYRTPMEFEKIYYSSEN